jgi:hypothetical protein
MRKTLAVVAMGVALALLPGIPAQAATTAPKRAAQCFEQNDPKWDPIARWPTSSSKTAP